jgi:hypothetical protein
MEVPLEWCNAHMESILVTTLFDLTGGLVLLLYPDASEGRQANYDDTVLTTDIERS